MVDISVDDQLTENGLSAATTSSSLNIQCEPDAHDLRDSGISMTDHSNLNNFNNTCYEDFDLRMHQQEMNINSSPNEGSPKIENPPPIPPKSTLNASFVELTGSLARKTEGVTSPENYCTPKLQNNGESSADSPPNI